MTRRKRYSTEFKREANWRCNEPDVTAVLVAEELGISARQLRRWRDAVERHGDKAIPGEGNGRDEGMMCMKRKLAKVEQELDFFREAVAGSMGRSEVCVYPSTPPTLSDSSDVSIVKSVPEWLLRVACTPGESPGAR
jgi:transposase